MRCLQKFKWVKLLRSRLPQGKGVMGYYLKLASHAAFRSGQAIYCGHTNEVVAGMWSGGIVGLKSILGVKNRQRALAILYKLSMLGYIEYSLNERSKKLTYQIKDAVIECSGKPCLCGNVYPISEYGFLCMPRNITEQLVKQNYIFEETDAWLDLWVHTVSDEPKNLYSFLSPVVEYGNTSLTLETLGVRWGWEKTKVWRFFQKYKEEFVLYRLPGYYGCVIFNTVYSLEQKDLPTQEEVIRIFHTQKSIPEENCVAVLTDIKRAYISPCRIYDKSWIKVYGNYNCQGKRVISVINKIRGPCRAVQEIIRSSCCYE